MALRPRYDNDKYVSYYMRQAGSGLPGFMGTSTQYGAGLGGMFRNLFRMALPIFKQGLNLAKPHLKTAARNIVSDVVTNITKRYERPPATQEMHQQEGSGLSFIARRALKRPPHTRGRDHENKKRKVNKRIKNKQKKSHHKRKRKASRQHRSSAIDIF